MRFADRLKELRIKAGISEMKLAELSGVSFYSIQNYSMGRRKPSFENVVKIARALGTDCTAFADCVDLGTGKGKQKGGKE